MDKVEFSPRTRKNNRRILSCLFLTVTVILSSSSALAQQNAEFPTKTTQSEPTTSSESLTPTRSRQHKSVWEAIWELLKRRKEPTLASRQFICPIPPGSLEDKNVIWSDRPMMIWQGEVSQITINLYDSFDPDREQQLLWSQTVTPQSSASKFHHLAYTGEALQPGKSYDWEIVISSSRRDRYTFQVMDLKQRDRVTTELLALENQLATKGVSEEEIALEKANYFAKQGLWSDALQQIYSTPNPSADFISNAREIVTYLCQSN